MVPRRTTKKLIRNKRLPVRKKAAAPSPSVFSSVDWGRFRLLCVAALFGLMWFGLWGRAFYLQIIEGPELAAKARRAYMGTELVEGARGSILDRNGNVLARSVDCPSVWVNPRKVKDKQQTAAILARHLNMPVTKVLKTLQIDKQFVWLRRKLDYDTAQAIKAEKLPGVYFELEYERVYPYTHLAGQLLGFVDIDDKGREGLEVSFEQLLGGQRVRQAVDRDASGRRMATRGTEGSDDLRGGDLKLTIDAHVQFFAEEALAENVEKFGAKWGGCIVVDVPTGEILAWAQYPFFDPNKAGEYAPGIRRNRLAADALEQGSTIKSFLIAAALEEGVVTPKTVINCEKGKWKIGKVTIHDTHPYASLPVSKILHVSSNIGAAKIGVSLGAGKYHQYLKRLGFGEKSGLQLASETKGILRNVSKWADVDLAASAFGQSFSATLVQMAQAYHCLASDGVKKPLRLVITGECKVNEDGEPEGALEQALMDMAEEDKIFSEETMVQVRAMLREVVEEEGGTGKQARIPGMVVGGKTGTAQKADQSGKYGKGRVGSFVGMIPIEQPRYLITVVLDEPTKSQYGGVIAAPVFRHVALRTMAYHGLLPDTDDPLVLALAEKQSPASSRGGQNTAAGTVRVAATATPVQAASVSASDSARQPGASSVVTNQVPAVVGMGVRSAVAALAMHGVVPVFNGKGGYVVKQQPESGVYWPSGSRECTLWLEERAL